MCKLIIKKKSFLKVKINLDIILSEKTLNNGVVKRLNERLPDKINKMAQLGDQYKDVCDLSAPQTTNKVKSSKKEPQIGENKS